MKIYTNQDFKNNTMFFGNHRKFFFAEMNDGRFSLVKLRAFSFLFKRKFSLLLDGYVDLPFSFDTKEEAISLLEKF